MAEGSSSLRLPPRPILGALVHFGQQAKLPVLAAARTRCSGAAKDPRVRAGAEMALKSVIAGRSTLSAVEGSEEAVPVPGGPVFPGSSGQGQDCPLPLQARDATVGV